MPRKIDFEVVVPQKASVKVTCPGIPAAEVKLPGKPGKPGKDGKDGKDGEDGYTPVKGKDYFTEADIAAMVDAVVARFEDGDKGAC